MQVVLAAGAFFIHQAVARGEAVEPIPMAERRLIYRSDELAPRVEMRHAIPGIGHPDRPHFDILAGVLEATVQRVLDDTGIPGRAGANFRVIHTSRFGVPSTLNLEVVLPDDSHLAAAEEAILEALRIMARELTDEADLALTRKTLRTEWFRTAANADALAFEIGHFQTMDRWRTLQAHLETREGTTAADIARLVRGYFVADNRVVGIVRPLQPEAWEVER